MSGGALERIPTPARSSIGFDASGAMHVGRISFTGTWQGTGQRRPITAVNQKPRANQTILYTPAWGATTPTAQNAAAVVLEPFPAAAINTDLKATVAAIPDGSTAIPADGAVLVATGDGRGQAPGRGAAGRHGHGAADPPGRVGLGRLRARRRPVARQGREAGLHDRARTSTRPTSPRASRAPRSGSSPTAA